MTQAKKTYKAPNITVETEKFWDAAKNGQLLIGECGECGKVHYYPRAICPHCFSDKVDWIAVSGRGEIYSFSVFWRMDPPFALAYIRLEEGVTMMSNIVDCDLGSLSIGQKVELVFKQADEGFAYPMFTSRAS